MAHLTEEELMEYRDAEAPDAAVDRAAVKAHLAECADCRELLATLDRLFAALDVPVPEPGPAYEREVWARIQDRLVAEPRRSWGFGWGQWVLPQAGLAAVVAVLLVGLVWVERDAFMHRGTPGSPATPVVAGPDQAQVHSETQAQGAASIRSRVVMAGVGDHLQRAELMLTEFNNTDGTARGTIDLTDQQAWAEDLVQENRLYRRSAADVQQDQVVALLDDLERVLLEVAHAPAETTPERLERLRLQLGTQDVLFKVRVAGAGMRDRQQMAAAAIVDAPGARSLSGSKS
jgi:predicted anti-sigma-YlaC factor YlaD